VGKGGFTFVNVDVIDMAAVLLHCVINTNSYNGYRRH